MVGNGHAVFADADGVIFTPLEGIDDVIAAAQSIGTRERGQAETLRGGLSLSEQLEFELFLKRREGDPGYTFRRHLRGIGGAIEE
jgi:regulator of RNase E activity RraA